MKPKPHKKWRSVPNPLVYQRIGDMTMSPGEALYNPETEVKIYQSLDTLSDGVLYLHLSISHPTRYPTWEELLEAKDMFSGAEDEMVQVLPRKSEYVNVHPNCFHLYMRLDGKDMIGR